MHDNLLAELRFARLRVQSLPLWERRQLVRRIFDQLTELRDARGTDDGFRNNPHLNRLIKCGNNTVADLPRLSDREFARVLLEFEALLVAMIGIIKTDHRSAAMN